MFKKKKHPTDLLSPNDDADEKTFGQYYIIIAHCHNWLSRKKEPGKLSETHETQLFQACLKKNQLKNKEVKGTNLYSELGSIK